MRIVKEIQLLFEREKKNEGDYIVRLVMEAKIKKKIPFPRKWIKVTEVQLRSSVMDGARQKLLASDMI